MDILVRAIWPGKYKAGIKQNKERKMMSILRIVASIGNEEEADNRAAVLTRMAARWLGTVTSWKAVGAIREGNRILYEPQVVIAGAFEDGNLIREVVQDFIEFEVGPTLIISDGNFVVYANETPESDDPYYPYSEVEDAPEDDEIEQHYKDAYSVKARKLKESPDVTK